MATRALWKGWLTVGELGCPVALRSVVSTSERISFHMVNRATGHRIRREFVDAETGKPVPRDDQAKGYEVGPDDYVVFEPEEIAAVLPESDKTIAVGSFLPWDEIDRLYFDKPYALSPSDASGEEAFALIRAGLAATKTAAVAEAVLFRRHRRLLLWPEGEGLVAQMLSFVYEVRSARDAFADVPKVKVEGEMLDLARHIIDTKKGVFDPAAFDDRYEEAVAELVRAKVEGRALPKPRPRKEEKVLDLMEALRASAKAGKAARAPARKPARKAG